MAKVIVVPEKDKFYIDLYHDNCVWINQNLGIPKLDEKNARYMAPYCLATEGGTRGVNRIFYITQHRKLTEEDNGIYALELGNSFICKPWDNMGQHRRFEYHDLSSFGMIEITAGLLLTLK